MNEPRVVPSRFLTRTPEIHPWKRDVLTSLWWALGTMGVLVVLGVVGYRNTFLGVLFALGLAGSIPCVMIGAGCSTESWRGAFLGLLWLVILYGLLCLAVVPFIGLTA